MVSGLFLFLLSYPLQAFSQDFPAKPITIYCTSSAGATTDLTSRALADGAEKLLGVPVVVENKTGGGHTVGTALLASKKPDGYTLAVLSSSALDTRHVMLNVAYDPFKDFTLILSYSQYPGGICVKADSPFKTLQDLIEHARKNPGALSYSSSGTGATQHLAVEYLAKQAKVKFKHVSFKGGTPATTALLGGHVDFTAGAGIHLQYVKQGLFRMLAVMCSEERDPNFPDIPTFKDLGYNDVPPGKYTLVAPRGLPEPVLKKIETTFTKVAQSPEFKKVLANLGVPFVFKDRRQLESEFPKVYKFYAELLKEIGVKTRK